MADEEFKIQEETSAEALSEQQGNDKRLYEEVIAGATPAGVDPGTIANARAAREAGTITREATASAKSVSDDAFSERVIDDDALAAKMGGIDPNGTLSAKTKAANSLARSHKETVDNHYSLIERERVSGHASLEQVRDNVARGLTIEQTEANTRNVVRNGSDDDLMALVNFAGSLPVGDDTKIAILEQYAANIGSRNLPAMGQTEAEEIRNATFTGSVEAGWIKRIENGSFSGSKAAAMSTDYLDSQLETLEARALPPDPALQSALEEYVQSIKDYRDDLRIKQPEAKITERMDRIVRLVDPAYVPAPRTPPPAPGPIYGPPLPPPPPPVYGPPPPPPVGGRADDV